jgi:hypothetical protein
MKEFIPTMYEIVLWGQFKPENQQILNRKSLAFFLPCPGRKETGRAAIWAPRMKWEKNTRFQLNGQV